jgi:hypothetical protein
MTTWTIKSEIDDPKRPLEVVEDQRNRGYKVWIEDENGRGVDDESLKKNDVQKTNHALYETGIGVLIGGQPQRLPLAVFMPAVCWLVTSAGPNDGRYLRTDRKPSDPPGWCLHRNFRSLTYAHRWRRMESKGKGLQWPG